MQVYGDRAHTARMRAALEGGSRPEPLRGRAVSPLSRHRWRYAISYRTN
jgi:hypothetical protein